MNQERRAIVERRAGRALALEVARAIEKRPDEFDQREWYRGCGTPSCVAGWTVWIMQGKPNKITSRTGENPKREAMRGLQLLPYEADEMFEPAPLGKGTETNPEEAVQMLRHYAGTGKVQWLPSDR